MIISSSKEIRTFCKSSNQSEGKGADRLSISLDLFFKLRKCMEINLKNSFADIGLSMNKIQDERLGSYSL